MKNKVVLFLSLMVAVLLLMAGCSSGDDENTIKVWTMNNSMEDFVINYEEENDVSVDVQVIPWGEVKDKFLTAIASGEGPDVVQVGTTGVPEYADAGMFMDLSDYVSEYENFNPDNFYEDAIGTTEYNGKTIGVPFHVDTRVLFYRTDILADVGYPEGPETWDDMVDASRKLAERGDDQYAIDLPRDDPQYPYMLAWQHGWNYNVDEGASNFEDPKFLEAMSKYETFYGEGLSQLEEGKELVQSFSDGSKPMFFSGPWDIKTINDGAPEIEGQWDVRVMPEKETNRSMIGGSHFGVFHNSEKVEQSLDFINWLADADTQLEWYKEVNELPANLEAWEDPVLADDPKFSVFGEQLESTEVLPMITEYTEMSEELMNYLEEVYRGGADLESTLEEYRTKVTEILSE
ncbi:sugar ABC transporter substrate-binding protein [Gracilibacillus suaedae]|uniref:sugar ABC transporter substrate-binding protein n=1 Tax=Gracilibacillus suaedae TaxID=2820273 RepID=UPI001ABED330|nr:sugar ABC transporter substrate-binding protein [Gracilibacillus suaedae]